MIETVTIESLQAFAIRIRLKFYRVVYIQSNQRCHSPERNINVPVQRYQAAGRYYADKTLAGYAAFPSEKPAY